ncbi:increased DNA methylation 1-like isoform X2 [Aristolochia californica]|uniref:increased DNA methylation 1-like isoform X2 n=1 Tax=Aristolochia californica TaxID=171875 RepID=UPI0035DFACF4
MVLFSSCEACIQEGLVGCTPSGKSMYSVHGNSGQTSSQSSVFVPTLSEESENNSSWCLTQLRKLDFGKTVFKGRRARKCRKRRDCGQLIKYRSATMILCDTNPKRRNPNCVLIKKGDKPERGCSRWVLRSSKRALQIVEGVGPNQHSARTILSWLMDSDMILPRQRVSYIHRRGELVMAEGIVTREGIKCKCCRKVYSLTKFEVHAGSASQCPANNIFLSDGRSLMQCQMQLVHSKEGGCERVDLNERKKGDYSCYERDKICSICHYGGQLVHCDSCPSSFHSSCVSVQDVHQGRWSCPTCRCTICGQSEYDADIQRFTPRSILYCDQCRHEYHVGCLRERGERKLERCPLGNWFCGRKCSKIFTALQKYLGKSKPVGATGLSWTILRPRKEVSFTSASVHETITEQHSKLWVALSVLHECFVPITELRTKRDLVRDVLFNNWSELKRLNFQGLYTMILEKDDELISVATIRIHGEKVAEMPLVATRVPYRRQGMCRLLVNEVEKLLSHLGVERLIVPAVGQVLEAWTTSFGFTKLTWSERLELLEYTFLNFQATTMCQKILVPSVLTKNKQSKVNEVIIQVGSHNGDTGWSGCSLMSGVIQTLEPIQILKPVGLFEFPSCTGSNTSKEVGLYSEGLIQKHGQIEQGEEALQLRLLRDGASEDGENYGFTDRVSPNVKVKQLHNPICRFRGLHYSRRNRSAKREST